MIRGIAMKISRTLPVMILLLGIMLAPSVCATAGNPLKGDAAIPRPATDGRHRTQVAELTDSVLFGDVWERPGFSKRDRSLVTISA